MSKRVVITSLGIISTLGFSPEEIVSSLQMGKRNFIRPEFDQEVAVCPIENFNAKKIIGRYKNSRYLNRGSQFAVSAAIKAIRNSGLAQEQIAESGLFLGAGPNLDMEGEFPEITRGKMEWQEISALWILKFLPNTAASAISNLAGIHGENNTTGTACSASTQAIGEAFRKIKDGYLKLAFAGAGDSRISIGGILAYKKAQALYQNETDPNTTYAAFEESRSGFIPGEGGAFLLLEELEHAKARGATIYAEVAGFGASMDGHNMTAPEPAGVWAEKAVTSAIKEAGLTPEQIDLISAHGTGTPLNDEMESSLIERVFDKPSIVALKSWIGHLSSACGAMELGILLSCLKENYLPEIKNLKKSCNPNLNYQLEAGEFSADNFIIENFGFGGQNSALVLKRYKS